MIKWQWFKKSTVVIVVVGVGVGGRGKRGGGGGQGEEEGGVEIIVLKITVIAAKQDMRCCSSNIFQREAKYFQFVPRSPQH